MNKIFILLLFSFALCSCQNNHVSESHEQTEKNTSSFSETTMMTKTTTDTTATETQNFSTTFVELPTGIPEVEAQQVENFKYSDFVTIDSEDDLFLTAIDEKYIYFEKHFNNFDDTSDIMHFKYNMYTDDITEFDGRISDYNLSSDTYAFVDNKLFSVFESFDERIHYVVDTNQNSAKILKTEPLNRDTDSIYNTYPVNDEEYAEVWFDIGDVNTFHIRLYEKNGSSKEIFKKDIDRSKEIYSYVVNDNKIYEYAQINDLSEPYLNVYNIGGTLLSTTYLEEVAKELKNSADSYVTKMDVFGDYFSINVYTSPVEKCFIYNEKLNSVIVIDECRYLSPSVSTDSETNNHILMSFISLPDEPTIVNLYCLNNTGEITKVAEGLSMFSSIVTDGQTLAYLKDGVLYKIII